jgi:hypothetical protein
VRARWSGAAGRADAGSPRFVSELIVHAAAVDRLEDQPEQDNPRSLKNRIGVRGAYSSGMVAISCAKSISTARPVEIPPRGQAGGSARADPR